jgi:hypothetical protein
MLSWRSGPADSAMPQGWAVLQEAREMAEARALQAGADGETLEVVEAEDVPLAYLPGNATRVRVKVVGDLRSIDVAR